MRALVLTLLVIGAIAAGLLLLNSTDSNTGSSDAAQQRDVESKSAEGSTSTDLAGVEGVAEADRLEAASPDSPTMATPQGSDSVTDAAPTRRRGRLRGRITDGAGSPIAAAEVSAERGDAIWMLGDEAARASTPATVSDALGLFSLECSAGEVTVRVGVDGFAPFEQTFDVPADGEEDAGDLRLAAGVTIRGRVVDSTGAGVPGAQLRRTPKSTGSLTIARLDGGKLVAETDDTGRFEIMRQAVGPYRFAVHHSEYPPASLSGTTGAANEVLDGLVVTLRPGASISGIVTGIQENERGRLVVRATPGGGGALDVLELGASGSRSAKVQDDGSFTVTGVEPGATAFLELHAGPRRWDGSSRRSERAAVKAGDAGVRIAYTRGASIVFRVTDPSGQPATPEGVSVGNGYAQDRELVSVDPSVGAFRIDDLWASSGSPTVRFQLRAPGFEDHVVDDLTLPIGGELDLGTIALKPRPQVRVTVTSAVDGQPVAGADVVMRPAPQDGPMRRRVSFRAEREEDSEGGPVPDFPSENERGTTDEAGVCLLDATIGETVVIEARHPEHALALSEPLHIAPGSADQRVELKLPAGGAIEVIVVDTLGQPAPSYPVIVQDRTAGRGQPGPGSTPDLDPASDELGRVTLTGLAAGEQGIRLGKRRKDGSFMMMPRIMVSDDGQEDDHDWTTVTVVAGSTVEATLVAPALGTVEGTLTELGVPLAGATITLKEDSDADSLGMMIMGGGAPAATVDARGEFTISELEEGDHVLVIEHPTRAMPTRHRISVDPGTNDVEIDLTVTVVEGRVLGPDGKPVAGATVEAKRHEPSSGRRVMATVIVASDEGEGDGMVMSIGGEGSEPVRTDAEGRYSLRGVVADAPIVVVARADGLDETRTEPFEVAAGSVEDDVELRFEITGELRVEIENFQPGMIAILRKRGEFSGDPKIEALSGAVSTIEGLAPGAWTVRVSGTRPGESVSIDPDEVDVDVVGGETRTASFVIR